MGELVLPRLACRTIGRSCLNYGPKHLSKSLTEFVWIELRSLGELELVHPEARRRRHNVIPSGVRSVDQIDVPRVDENRQIKYGVVGAEQEPLTVPEMVRPCVGNGSGRTGDVTFLASPLGNPDRECTDPRVTVFAQHVVDFGGPPKAAPSSRRHKHQYSDLANIRIESSAQRLGVLPDGLVGLRLPAQPAGALQGSEYK
jgi:hypothetical protein